MRAAFRLSSAFLGQGASGLCGGGGRAPGSTRRPRCRPTARARPGRSRAAWTRWSPAWAVPSSARRRRRRAPAPRRPPARARSGPGPPGSAPPRPRCPARAARGRGIWVGSGLGTLRRHGVLHGALLCTAARHAQAHRRTRWKKGDTLARKRAERSSLAQREGNAVSRHCTPAPRRTLRERRRLAGSARRPLGGTRVCSQLGRRSGRAAAPAAGRRRPGRTQRDRELASRHRAAARACKTGSAALSAGAATSLAACRP